MFGALKLQTTQFLPPQSVWGQCAPAENDTLYAGKTIQGQVSCQLPASARSRLCSSSFASVHAVLFCL